MGLPTIAFTMRSGRVSIKVELYGEVSSERYTAELKVAQHRAEQLSTGE